MNRRNWAGNYTYAAERIHEPDTVAEVQELVRYSTKVRALGSRHSFNGIADCDYDLISLARLDRVIAIDADKRTVTIEGGVRYGALGGVLHRKGFAVHNLASLPHISVAGACATATHGSGEDNGNLAVSVSGMEFVDARGDVVSVSRNTHGEGFNGFPVSLGAFGIVTSLTLDVVPAFDIRQEVFEHLPFAQLAEHLDAIEASAYSVSLFTDWSGDQFDQVWLKHRVHADAAAVARTAFHAALPAMADRHPIPGMSAGHCTPQMGVAGASLERLPHFRMDFTPGSGAELQSEYFVPRRHAVAALRAMFALGPRITPLLLVSEVRAVASDPLWMSPCHEEDCIALHFTWKPDWPAVRSLLPVLEAALVPFRPRPHWGKLFTMPPAHVRPLYPRLADFRALVHHHDPSGKFRNAVLDPYLS